MTKEAPPAPILSDAAEPRSVIEAAFAFAAVAGPTLLAYNAPPSSTLLNQVFALVGWGAWLIVMAMLLPSRGLSAAVKSPLTLALLILAALSTAAIWTAHVPSSLALSTAGIVLASLSTALIGAALQHEGLGLRAMRAFCLAIALAAVFNSVIALIQVYAPTVPDAFWIAKSGLEGRAVGNMRQPNHVSSLLMWGIIAVAWLGEGPKAWRPWLVWLLALLFVFAVVLTGSRTGAIGTALFVLWAALDKRLSRSTRLMLALMPVFYGLCWLANAAWAEYSHHVFGGETRFSTAGDISSSRFGIWSNTIELIKMHPWFGVGFGELNFAWTLTPFPGRPVAFFDHTHNLPLQLIVELGIPIGLLVLGLLAYAMVRAFLNVKQQPNRDPSQPPQAPVAAFMIVLMIGLHSLLEYPLWYAYFLLPTAFAFGLCLGDPPLGRAAATPAFANDNRVRPLLLAAILLFGSGFYVLYDYMKVVNIFVADADAAPLGQRIVEGRRSVFFAHHADYAAATISAHPSQVMPAFKRAPHYLLDARLMIAWARALNEAGETDKARYVAQRLKEFRNEGAAEFFAPCNEPTPQADKPFQCQQPTKPLTYEDFR